MPALVKGVAAGRRADVSRAITLVESNRPDHRHAAQQLLMELLPHAGGAHRVGISGVPGVGKSTFIETLGSRLTGEGHRVAVLAVDPSSPFSGGALLGDRVRMGDHALDPEVYIRSMGARGHLGGLARSTPQAVRVLEAAGCDVVVVETVGVGQSEVEVAGLADTTLVLLAPGMGDGIQAAKAGILEVADVLVVNKADRDGADDTVRDLRHMIQLGNREQSVDWRTPVVRTVASRGDGIPELVDALAAHRDWLLTSGRLEVRRRERARSEIEAIALAELRRRVGGDGGPVPDDLASSVASGTTDVYAAASRVVERLTQEPRRQ